MRNLRRIAWVCLVWLTAPMTLVATTPQWHCRCPEGSPKEFCPKPAQQAACCCQHSAPQKPAKATRSCCRTKPQAGASTSPVQAKCGNCTRAATPQISFSAGRGEPRDAASKSAPWTATLVAAVFDSCIGTATQAERAQHAQAPPVDRVIVFEHLTI